MPPRLPVRVVSRSALITALAIVAPAVAAQDPTAARLADLRLATAVRLALADDACTRALDVDVTARAGTVALDGRVAELDRRTAVEIARAVPGVVAVAGEGAEAMRDALPPALPVARPGAASVGREAAPERPALPDGGSVAYHTVARGETLFSLARRYGTTVEAVMRLNGMTRAEIRIGQRLRMR